MINEYKKIKEARIINSIGTNNEQEDALNTEKMNIQIAIEESLKLSRIEEFRANNRKRYKEELRRALNISMQTQ